MSSPLRATRHCGAILIALAVIWHAMLLPAAEPRFVAFWSDGSQTADEEVHDWHRAESHPSLKGRALFDAKNPVRTLCDLRLKEAQAVPAYVEFVDGDRLPGSVVGYAESGEQCGPLPHLLVKPGLDFDLPGVAGREHLPVRLDLVRRIVWRNIVSGPSAPGSLVTVEGRRVSLRAVRWNENGVQVLAETGTIPFGFSELAELNLPAVDPWDASHRTLAILAPDAAGRLMRMESVTGARITTSLARLQPRSVHGDEPKKWYHLVQPAWALEAVALPHRTIRQRSFFVPSEVPLTLIEPLASRHRAAFSAGWSRWQLDKNVQGGTLRAAGRTFGWGFGTHAQAELDFELPPGAKALRAQVALDQLAGVGGCARGKIVAGEKTLFTSPLLIGSGQVVDTKRIELPGPTPTKITLVSDAAYGEGPAGSDPLDVRDLVDWLEPTVELDAAQLRRHVERATPRAVWGPGAWTLEPPLPGSWHVLSEFQGPKRLPPLFGTFVELDAPLTWTQRVVVDGGRAVAVLKLARPPKSSSKLTFEVSLDGRRIAHEPVPALDESGRAKPVIVQLAEHSGREIEIAIRFDPGGKKCRLDWRGIVFSPAAP